MRYLLLVFFLVGCSSVPKKEFNNLTWQQKMISCEERGDSVWTYHKPTKKWYCAKGAFKP